MTNEWMTCTLGNVLAVLRNGVNCKQDKQQKGDRISRIETISDGHFDINRVGYSSLGTQDKVRHRLQQGDILFSHINSPIHVGKTAVFDAQEAVYHGVNLLLMRPTAAVVPGYLNLALRHLFQSGYWLKTCKQSVNQASVNQQDISRAPFRYPKSLSEQHRIVSILDQAFEGIAIAKANAEKNLQNARALFESRLQSVFAQRGSGWTETTLEEVCQKITDGKHGDCKDQDDSGYYFLSAKDVRGGTLNYETARQITKADFEETHRRTDLEPGDILITNAGTIGRMAIAPADGRTRKTTFQKSVAILKLRREILDSSFAFHCLSSGLSRFISLSAGAAQKNLLLRDLRRYRFTLPKALKQQKAVALELDKFSAEAKYLRSIYQQKLAALEALKKSLLHQAFTGNL